MGYLGYKPADKPLTAADITDSIITSAKIVDGTITNSDVASSIITGQTAETSIAGGDSILIYDDSATALRKMTRTNFVSGIGATAGQVIQVLSATDSTERSTSSTSYVTGSNTLSVSITPSSASNKILIIVSSTVRSGDDGYNSFYTIFRDSTNLGVANGMTLLQWNTGDCRVPLAMTYLDSPSTTSATTYQVYMKAQSPTVARINFNSCQSSITVMEVKG